MRLDNLIDTLIEKIKADPFFDNISVIRAYPDVTKPTRLSRAYIALSLGEIDLSSSQLDSSSRAGEVRVCADIITPVNMEQPDLCDIFVRLCRVLDCYNIVSIYAGDSEVQRLIQARHMRTQITLKDEFLFGGGIDG